MGIAWFDDRSINETQPALRVGGLPLVGKEQPWPHCLRCETPLLFRAQVPLSVTSLASASDDSLLQVFECYHRVDGELCNEGVVLWTQASVSQPLRVPRAERWDVIIEHVGGAPQKVLEFAAQLADEVSIEGDQERDPETLNNTVLASDLAQDSAAQIKTALETMGARVRLVPSAPTHLPFCYAAKLVPFDDGQPGMRKTTLPPLGDLMQQSKRTVMRGLLGGSTPGYRDHSLACDCGKPTRTAVRLLANVSANVAGGVRLDPGVIQVCMSCRKARLFRTPLG